MAAGGLRAQYEAAVIALRARVAEMRAAGLSAEEIARRVFEERRRLAGHFKAETPEPLRTQIHHRTLAVYGDAAGPSVEWLRARGKSWDDIIDSATRPGGLSWLPPTGQEPAGR
jgi:hypothetical protein